MKKKTILTFSIFVIILVKLFGQNADSLISLNSKSNILYLGIDNYIYLKKEFRNKSLYYFTTNNGMLFRDSNSLNIIPRKKPDAFIVAHKINELDTIELFRKRFSVSYTPQPCLMINNKCLDDIKSFKRENVINHRQLSIKISDDIMGSYSWLKIKRFSLGYSSGGIYNSYDTEGDVFSKEMITALKKIRPGQVVNLKVSVESSGNIVKYLPIYSFTIY